MSNNTKHSEVIYYGHVYLNCPIWAFYLHILCFDQKRAKKGMLFFFYLHFAESYFASFVPSYDDHCICVFAVYTRWLIMELSFKRQPSETFPHFSSFILSSRTKYKMSEDCPRATCVWKNCFVFMFFDLNIHSIYLS